MNSRRPAKVRMSAPKRNHPVSREIPVWLAEDLADLRHLLRQLAVEIRILRRERLPASDEVLQSLLHAIHSVYGDTPVTASWLFEAATEKDSDSVHLYQCLVQVAGQKPTVSRLSRLLRQSVGTFGEWRLTLTQEHSRAGNLFSVTNVSKLLTTDDRH